MARLHTSKRGKSSSKRPVKRIPPEWLQRTPEWIEEKIVELARKGVPPSQIGIMLRDQYGVPFVRFILKKRITKVLKEHDLLPDIPEDLENLIRKAINLRKHLEVHKKDYHSKRGLQITESKIYRLVKYYKSVGRLPPTWRYKPKEAHLLLR